MTIVTFFVIYNLEFKDVTLQIDDKNGKDGSFVLFKGESGGYGKNA